ncbi:GNAT family N-acetyltransferase [Salaquimonas pukyongi]|uniref:GNAT family N-acetyltransferase n=1 Tax=Salaquimonas pukyongi TaxID=2712698 RepID=UPI00096BB242|nr:GNAT family N-acetyltransferase [Salaquimonas pukyongi]
MSFLIRPAEEKDFDAVTAIYGEAVAHGTASFELTVPGRDDLIARHDALVCQGYPYLVLEADGAVQGYAYAGPYRARPAYRFVVENSIYLDARARGKGYGKTLLMELVSICEKAGFRQMIAVIGDSANSGSVAVHAACGFRMVGTLKDVGWKHGQWLDTVLMQLPLGAGGAMPPDAESLPGRMETITKTA